MSEAEKAPLLSAEKKPAAFTEPEEIIKDREYKLRWLSISVAYVVNFLLMLQNSMYWSSLWPYLSQIDPTADENFYGFVIMAFNLASAIASPLFGFWCNKIHNARIPIMVGISINILGNVFTAFVEAFSNNRKWILLVGRFITGWGVGNAGVLFAYVAMASLLRERNMAISIRATVNALALLIGPGIQVGFVPIGYPGYVSGPFHFDMYTAPAWVNIGLGLLQLLFMGTLFREYWVAVKESDDPKEKIQFDKLAAFVCIWSRLATQFCMTYDVTIGSPLTMTMFRWTREEAVSYNGTIQLVSGLLMVIGNMFVGSVVLRYVQERTLLIVGLTCFVLFYVISFPYPGLPPLIEEGFNVTLAAAEAAARNETDPTLCTYSWCSYTTRVNLIQYLFAYVMIPLSISIAFVPNGTLFTKVLGPGRQGTMNGFFAGGGQLAMTVSPIICSSLFQYYGPRVTWASGALVTGLSVLLVVVTYKRLVPYDDYQERINGYKRLENELTEGGDTDRKRSAD